MLALCWFCHHQQTAGGSYFLFSWLSLH